MPYIPDAPLPPTVPNQIDRIIRAFEFYSYSDIQIKEIRHSTIVSARGFKEQASVIVHYGNRPFTYKPTEAVRVTQGLYLEFRNFSYSLLENAT